MSSVLGSSVSFVTSLSFSTTGGGIGGPSYETPLRVVIALASFLGFGMVLLGKELELEAKPSEVVLRFYHLLQNLRHLDRLNSKNYKKYRVGGVPRSHGEDIDEGVL
ncbi:hypothetical protein Tco_1193685 [Tanacetum coccineum]